MTGNGITTSQVSASYPDSYEIGGLAAYRPGETPGHSPISKLDVLFGFAYVPDVTSNFVEHRIIEVHERTWLPDKVTVTTETCMEYE